MKLYLCKQYVVKEKIGLVLVLGNISVLVHAKYAWLRIDGQVVYVGQIALVVAIRRRKVNARLVESVIVVLDNLVAIEPLQQGLERASVPVVGDTAAVIAFACQVLERLVLHLVVLIEEHGQLHCGYAQIGLVELVGYVPADGSKFAPFLRYCMKETKTEQQFLQRFLQHNQINKFDRLTY